MPPSFPCPNPACTQVFAPEDVRGATSLTCPKCGTVFRFRAGKAPAVPVAKPVSPPPPAVPVADPVADEADVFVPPPGSPKPRRAPGKRSRAAGKRWWLLAPVGMGLLVIALAVAAWSLRDQGPDGDAGGPAVESKAMNYRLRVPRAPWAQDKGVERELGASLAMRRTDPSSWFALVVHDYKDRMPREDELLREAVSRLNRLFKNGAEWEQKDEDTFAGLPAQRLVFSAENSNNVAVSGECLMAAHDGLGYWFFGWTPSATAAESGGDVQREWGEVREGFALLKERQGWGGKVPEVVLVEGRNAGYRLKYTKGLWEQDDNPADADLLLHGRDPDHPQDGRRWAWVRAFVRPAADDPEAALQEARAFVGQREKALYPELKMEAAPREGKGGLPDGAVELGGAAARLARLRVKKGEDYEHFYAVAAVPRPAYTLVIVCECAWPQREAWEDRFGPVLHSLQFEKK